MGWVWLVSPVNGIPHRVDEGALPAFVARGFEVTDLPGELDADDPDFIEMFEEWQPPLEDDLPADELDVEPVREAAPANDQKKE